MIRIIVILAGLAAFSSFAWASCPPGTVYGCTQGFNGKVVCGCR